MDAQHFSSTAALYGTAQLKYKNEERQVSPLPTVPEKAIKQKGKNRRCAHLKAVIHSCFPCICKTTESYSLEEASNLERGRGRQYNVTHINALEKNKNAHFRHIIPDMGRHQCFTEPPVHVFDGIQIGREVVGAAYEEQNKTSVKMRGDTMTSPGKTLPEASVKNSGQENSVQVELTSPKQAVTKVDDDNKDADTHMKSLETGLQNAQGSLAEGLKDTVEAIAAGLNQSLPIERPSVRRPLYVHLDVQKWKRLQPKDLLRFRFPPAHQLMPQALMMTSSNEFCHPRFSDTSARKASLRNCPKKLLRGYKLDELARAGWFYNQRALITFCCGLEMPVRPSGNLQNVHRSMSPQCTFAVGLQSSAPNSSSETQGAAAPLGGAQASDGEVEFQFRAPVQVTDDAPVMFLPEEGAACSAVFHQETAPSHHWMTDASGFAGSLTSDASYRESLVTNETQLVPEPFEPYIENPIQRPPPQPDDGQLRMRGAAPNPMAPRHILPTDPMLENLHQGNPQWAFFAHFDQLNLSGDGDVNHTPRHPHFGAPPMRLESFNQGWPANHSHTACRMADAGFFYAGYGDAVLCYSCGIGVRRWDPTDDPWIEHARLRPMCVFMKTIQGQYFIDAARDLTRDDRHPNYRQVKLEANRRRQRAEGPGEGVAARVSFREGDLGVELLCKFCYRRERNYMMMPCRHLAVCENCSWPLLGCPVCYAYVEETVRTDV